MGLEFHDNMVVYYLNIAMTLSRWLNKGDRSPMVVKREILYINKAQTGNRGSFYLYKTIQSHQWTIATEFLLTNINTSHEVTNVKSFENIESLSEEIIHELQRSKFSTKN